LAFHGISNAIQHWETHRHKGSNSSHIHQAAASRDVWKVER